MDATEAVRRERLVVGGVDVHTTHDHEQREHQQLDDHHDVVGARALLDALEQQHGDRDDDAKGRQVHEHRYAGDARRGVHERPDSRVAAGLHVPVAVREPSREIDTESRQQGREIAGPSDRDRHVTHGVFEDECPTDDPSDDLAERGVRIGVGAARLRYHGRELGVAERRETTHGTEEHERDDQRRPGAVSNYGAVGQRFSGRSCSERRENAGADNRTDGQHDKIASA